MNNWTKLTKLFYTVITLYVIMLVLSWFYPITYPFITAVIFTTAIGIFKWSRWDRPAKLTAEQERTNKIIAEIIAQCDESAGRTQLQPSMNNSADLQLDADWAKQQEQYESERTWHNRNVAAWQTRMRGYARDTFEYRQAQAEMWALQAQRFSHEDQASLHNSQVGSIKTRLIGYKPGTIDHDLAYDDMQAMIARR